VSPPRARILIVNALPNNLLVHRALLEDLGADILLARSASEALQHVQDSEPAVILLALDMPDLDGLETARRLRSHRHGRHAPIIFLAPWASDAQIARTYDLGAVDFIQTPVMAPALRTKVRTFVDLYETHAALARANQELESRVAERTQALQDSNERLHAEVRERRRVEQEREALLARERELSQLKDQFLATMSHELRTPLHAIFGWVNLLRTRELDRATQERALETIERNARTQKRLIEDLLDVSRIVAGKMALELGNVDPVCVVESALQTMHPEAHGKGLRVIPMLEPQVGVVRGDCARLQQVVCNLLSNAIKFTPAGGRIEVSLQRRGFEIELAVQDSGQGIKPEFLPLVFDRFRQEDGSISRRHGGLGVGLTIAHHLVKLHNGSIEVHSAGPGTGALFRVRLPVREGQASAPSRWPAGADFQTMLSELRLLVVDDDPAARELLCGMLQAYGAEVSLADSGHAALSLLFEQRPDVLIADLGMPGMDGYALIERVRALDPDLGGGIPAVAVTAYASPQDRQRALQAGFQDHVAKPLEAAELALAIASLTGRIQRVQRGSQDRSA
jgi:signal transduction histidine kinase